MRIADRMLAIRADADARIGAGHVMRCVALADAWHRHGGRVEWFCRPLPPLLAALLTSRGIAVHEIDTGWSPLERWAGAHQGSWVAIDGYAFQEGPARVRAAGAKALVIADDARWGRYDCDALVNQVIGAEDLRYQVPRGTLQMCGTRFCLLRREFLGRQPRSPRSSVDHLFISFGGHDTHQLSSRIGSLIARHFPRLHIDVAAGVMPGMPPIDLPSIALHSGTDLSAIMQRADIAIVAAGSVCWELAYLGVPAVTITVADNQEPIARGLDAAGAVRSLGWFDDVSDERLLDAVRTLCDDPPRRLEMSDRGRRLVDGNGADRVVGNLLQAA